MIDKFGTCPNPDCGCSWDGEDILDNLRKVSALSGKSEEELVNLAFQSYGYNNQNKKHFSRGIFIKIDNNDCYITAPENTEIKQLINAEFIQCPDCKKIFDLETGDMYNNLQQIKTQRDESYSRESSDTHEIKTVEGLGDN